MKSTQWTQRYGATALVFLLRLLLKKLAIRLAGDAMRRAMDE